MKKFLVLYRSTMSNKEQMMSVAPEQRKAIMDAWAGWVRTAGTALVDMGAPFGDSSLIRATTVQGHIGGYSMIQAESLDAAKRMFNAHPHFGAPGASIELLDLVSMPGM